MEDFVNELIAETQLSISDYQYFNQLLKHRTIVFNTDIDEKIIEALYLPLRDFERDSSTEPVTLILNSSGGSLSDGLVMCNVIDNYKKPLEIIVPAYACSMATIILSAGSKNPNVTKKCYPFSFALLHCGQTELSGETRSVEDTLQFTRSVDKNVRDYIIANTNITPELYDAHNRNQWYLNSQDLLDFGFVNEIIGAGSEK